MRTGLPWAQAARLGHFDQVDRSATGLPSVTDIAARPRLSTTYLSSLLQQLTGRTAQQHIQHEPMEKAKRKLSTTERSVSGITYQLGFEHSQRFNEQFKSRMEVPPVEFGRAFN